MQDARICLEGIRYPLADLSTEVKTAFQPFSGGWIRYGGRIDPRQHNSDPKSRRAVAGQLGARCQTTRTVAVASPPRAIPNRGRSPKPEQIAFVHGPTHTYGPRLKWQ